MGFGAEIDAEIGRIPAGCGDLKRSGIAHATGRDGARKLGAFYKQSVDVL